MIGATYIWESSLARFGLERDRQRVAAFVPFLRRAVGWVIRASKKRRGCIGHDQVLVGRWSVPFVRQHGQRVKLDSFLMQLLGLVRRGLAVNRAALDLAVVHLASLFGKSPPNIIGISDEMF